jgi:type IV pilus assembly protein PilE
MKRNGFTLIEVMIVVAIIGILAAVALPSYTSYINRGKITDAVAALADYRIKMEQYFQDNRNYGTADSACPVSVISSKYFVFACTVGSDTPTVSYVASATSIAGALGSGTGDYTYTINQDNSKTTSKFKGATVTGKSCWLVRGDEC